jgi:predicted Kef-type K+ transport protein
MAEPPIYSRERFLLRCVAWIIGVQFGVLILYGVSCSYGYFKKINLIHSSEERASACPDALPQIRQSAAESLGVLLALLGGGALAADELRRARKGRDEPPPPDDEPRG